MKNTARLFHCVRCRHQVVICSHCDRGNIYCGRKCAQEARRESLRAAGRRYQRSRRGRLTHAERQSRYRNRRKKVTHQGSSLPLLHDSLVDASKVSVRQNPRAVSPDKVRCDFCGRLCSALVRLGFLRNRRRHANRQPIVRPSSSGQCP